MIYIYIYIYICIYMYIYIHTYIYHYITTFLQSIFKKKTNKRKFINIGHEHAFTLNSIWLRFFD